MKKTKIQNDEISIKRKMNAEIFTPKVLVDQMLDKLEHYAPETFIDPSKTVLDPACGDGNFIIEVVKRKIDGGSTAEQAVSTVYGVDIMKDNIESCKNRIVNLIEDRGTEVTKEMLSLIDNNIRCLDTAKYPKGSLDYDFSFEKEEKESKNES